VAHLIDSLLANLTLTGSHIRVRAESGDSGLSALINERIQLFCYSRGISISEDSPEEILVRVNRFSLRYPEATKMGFFSSRIIRRRIELEVFLALSGSGGAWERTLSYEDWFLESSLRDIEDPPPFSAEVEKRTLMYYLWEPVLVAALTVFISYIFFASR